MFDTHTHCIRNTIKVIHGNIRRIRLRYILSCCSCKAASIAACCCWYVAAVDTTVVPLAGVSIVGYVVGAVIVGM